MSKEFNFFGLRRTLLRILSLLFIYFEYLGLEFNLPERKDNASA